MCSLNYKIEYNKLIRREVFVAKRKRFVKKEIFEYECTISGETYKTTKKATSPDDLVSVNAYYELNPEKDDRPDEIKAELGLLEQ